jgi:hypothetical protein
MSPQTRQRIRREADLIGRVAEYYRARFIQAIDRLNHAAPPGVPGAAAVPATDLACLRLCVEAVDMMLASQDQLARAVRELTAEQEPANRSMRPAA